MSSRYVVVSDGTGDLVIKRGPLLWDGVTPLPVPAGTHLIAEDAALAAGYSMPPDSVEVSNRNLLVQRASAALDGNNTYLAVVTPTNTQVAAQVTRLTREVSGLIRLILSRLDTADGS